MRRLAIWDVDGTLVDSRQVIQEAMVAAFETCQLAPPPYDATRQIVGLSLGTGIARLAPAGIGAADLTRLVDAYRNAFTNLRKRPALHEPVYDGAIALLDRLKQGGWLLAIATGKTHRGLAGLFEKHPIDPYFDSIWCAEDGPGKPHPFMVEQAMQATGAEPCQTVMIGDATFDMEMGRVANVRTLGVSWGFGTASELVAAGADEVHHDFASLESSLLAQAVKSGSFSV